MKKWKTEFLNIIEKFNINNFIKSIQIFLWASLSPLIINYMEQVQVLGKKVKIKNIRGFFHNQFK